jgi:Asp-tRNA(Asn)/Glu-tRNA(Gln) amidotransferase C subunit
MLSTLHAQLHFVRDIQRVNTEGVEPLYSIRDETAEGMREATITVDTLRSALAEEDVFGRCKRPRRRKRRADQENQVLDGAGVEDWDVLGCASQKVGRYFVVRSGSGKKEEVKD